MELCLPSYSICFWSMRTSIFASVQLGLQTLWGNDACDCDEIGDDRVEFDAPLAYPPRLPAVGAEEADVRLSKNSDLKPTSMSMSASVDGHCELLLKSTMSYIT